MHKYQLQELKYIARSIKKNHPEPFRFTGSGYMDTASSISYHKMTGKLRRGANPISQMIRNGPELGGFELNLGEVLAMCIEEIEILREQVADMPNLG